MTETEFDSELKHIGIKRKSGRYPWGSGDTPFQRSNDFKATYYDLKKNKGLKDTEIAEYIDSYIAARSPSGEYRSKFTTTHLRAANSLSTEEIFAENSGIAQRLKEKGMGATAIGKQMGVSESTVRGWLAPSEKLKTNSNRAIMETLKEQSEKKPFLDVGKGNNLHMGVTRTMFNTALAGMGDEGYTIHTVRQPQAGTGKMTTFRILTKENVPWSEAARAVREGKHQIIAAQSDDGGQTFRKPESDKPVSVDLKRVDVRWGPEGGSKMDGIIELRRGVEDLNLGSSRYAQVRVAVNGTHYLKGMAMYADDLPAGVDIRFNTPKAKDDPKINGDKLGAMKEMKTRDGKIDPDSPFGAQTMLMTYVDSKGKTKNSALNIVNKEGDWDNWSRNLSSQMLSKQSVTLASAQLKKARAEQQEELDKIKALTNPVVKEKLLKEFAEKADAAAVHLKAAPFDNQATRVLLPLNSVRPHEIYAPGFNNGEKVVLVRYPHAGPFEIPELTVNNNNSQASRLIKGAKDAVGIHHTVAEQLSGADFDGDTVLVIPNDARKVKTSERLKGLEDFNPQIQYRGYEGMSHVMTKQNTQTEMGKISNLITDMTIRNANQDEIARAVRHSMVVIDAEKKGLDYKRSEKEHNIAQLKRDYQGGANKGASTLISRASADERIPAIKPRPAADGGPINKKTGALEFVPTGEKRMVPIKDRKTGEITGYREEDKKTKGSKAQFAKDALDLVSDGGGKPIERIYAEHSNSMKALANQARLEFINLSIPGVSKAAAAAYAPEVKSLDAKLKVSLRNAPLERRAQSIASGLLRSTIDANPGMDKDDIKKARYRHLEEARNYTDSRKRRIGESDDFPLTDREWEAIQAGAVSKTVLREILANADMKRVRELATPRPRSSLTPGQMARARQLESRGLSVSEIAERLGLPRSTVSSNLRST